MREAIGSILRLLLGAPAKQPAPSGA
jgi:hypothetical protein